MPDGLSPRGTDAGSAQPSRPALCSRRRVRAEGWGQDAGRSALSLSGDKQRARQERLQPGCPPPLHPPSESHLAAKWEPCFHPKLTADVKFHTRCKSTCSSRDFFYRSLMLYTFKIHSEWIPIIQSNKWALYGCWGKQKKIWGLRDITSPE